MLRMYPVPRRRDLSGNPPSPEETALIIHPARNLAEGHRYIVALRDLRDANGDVIRPQAAFSDLVAGHGGRPSARQFYSRRHIFPGARTGRDQTAVAVSRVGLSFTIPGGDAIDIAYHATVLPLLLLTLAAVRWHQYGPRAQHQS